MASTVDAEKRYLAQLLEASQRSAFFLRQSEKKLTWPIEADFLEDNRKNAELFETLSAVNERFAKLQDTLAAAMRHTALLMSEPADSFLKVLAFFEKRGVLESVEIWQESRMIRNMAAHEYETDYGSSAESVGELRFR